MPTYNEIQDYVPSFVPKTCWIADIKAAHGLTTRRAANRADPGSRMHSCPPDKRVALEAAMREVGAL
ncbi:hypothetical protein FJ425_03665 [Mesorhizobium sp. B2-7-2]|nr:hypothetical protein FJ423_18220 [Mesorhizobium sp. B2-8-9]TPJ30837.1 hypothetical protein FJ425_03665 [Mesorhizobium sp. B2-7-2]